MKNIHIFLTFIVLFYTQSAFTQDLELITYLDGNFENLPAECIQNLDNWGDVSSNEDFYSIQLETLEDIQNDHRINFRLPQIPELISATADNIKTRPDGSLVWSGIIDCYLGNVVLIENEDYTIGYINYENESYTIRRLCEDSEVLITHSTTEHDQCGNQDQDDSGSNDGDDSIVLESDNNLRNSSCISTMLILYTDLAEQQGDPLNDGQLLFENTLLALNNSNVSHSVKLVGIEHVDWNDDETGIMIQEDLESITYDSQANQIRDEKSADIVMLLTGDSYLDAFGISWLEQLDEEHGYTITEITSPAGQQTFPHEWAHDFGCRHDLIIDQTDTHAHGMRFFTGISILGYIFPGENASRQLHYSNPDVLFDGAPTGVEDQQDNARQLDELGCTIAAYRSTNDPCDDFVSSIDGTSFIVAGVEHEWCADVYHCPDGEATFEWEIFNTDPFGWQSAGQDECLTLLAGNANIFIRLKTTCSSGCEYIDYLGTVVAGIVNEDCIESRFKEEGKLEITNLSIYPNPTSNFAQFRFENQLSNKSTYELIVHNVYGQSVLIGNYKGLDLLTTKIDISNYEKGTYFISIESEDEFAVAKFLVN